jgi:hydrogenase nickel incorporation protein HypA/HybF
MLMHELSIALSIIDGVLEEAEQQGAVRVAGVHLRLGPLSGVDEQALSFAYPLACQGTPLEGSRLVVQRTEVALYCPVCERECTPAALHDLRCPICGSCESRIFRGTELEITGLETLPLEVPT